MTASVIRILLVADTHLGFDLPLRPRIERRRRGNDFFANLEMALQPALRGEVDLVVHGGDLLYRSRVPPALIEMAMAPLVRVAASGVPVYLVPGNHERSRIPLHLWARHPNLFIFDRPRTFLQPLAGGLLALSGFPFAREVRDRFVQLVGQTGYLDVTAGTRLLCLHQTVEGAQVGPSDYTFRGGPDVVRGRDIPQAFSAVLAGHIHRAQVLTHRLDGRRLAAPVIYPGSIERTAFAERHEDKGYALVSVDLGSRSADELPERPLLAGEAVAVRMVALPARPMVLLDLEVTSANPDIVASQLHGALAALAPDAVVRVRLCGPAAKEAFQGLSAATLRRMAPPTMNVELAPEGIRPRLPARRGPAPG